VGTRTLYRHRQLGKVTLAALGASVVLVAAIFAAALRDHAPAAVVAGVVLALVVACLVLFATLTVEVDGERVRLWFGPGLIRRSFALSDVVAARPVRNRWWYGWGVRLTPHGWLFNVSGLDAVELELRSGRRFRIGTDEPRPLAEAIESARAARGT
jgi:hypothetical protein